jgi:hypothetical protein
MPSDPAQQADSEQVSPDRGSLSYENWKAFLAEEEWKSTLEYPLFTDAHLRPPFQVDHGPYHLINTVSPNDTKLLLPAILLRLDYHTRYEELGQLEETNVERYHGGLIHDEVSALLSLCLGIRLKAGGKTRYYEPGGDPKGHPYSLDISENPILQKPITSRLVLPQALAEFSLTDASQFSDFVNDRCIDS